MGSILSVFFFFLVEVETFLSSNSWRHQPMLGQQVNVQGVVTYA